MNFLPIPFTIINEHFKNNENDDENYSPLFSLFVLLTSFIAAAISWHKNTIAGYRLSIKLACAFTAFNFGIFYIFYFLLFVFNTDEYKNKLNHCTKYCAEHLYN
jgi:apolipoprotein N-acyltransferase